MELVVGTEFVTDDTDDVVGRLVYVPDFNPVSKSASALVIKVHYHFLGFCQSSSLKNAHPPSRMTAMKIKVLITAPEILKLVDRAYRVVNLDKHLGNLRVQYTYRLSGIGELFGNQVLRVLEGGASEF